MLKSLKSKYVVIGLVLIMSQLASILVGHDTVSIISEAGSIDKNVYTVRNFMQGDMMHDAIRGDVLNGLLSYKTNDRKNFTSARQDLVEHSKEFQESLDKIIDAHLSPEISAEIDQARVALVQYTKAADTVFSVLESGNDATEIFHDFEKQFESMEKKNSDIGDMIERETAGLKEQLALNATQGKQKLSIITALGLLISLIIIFYPITAVFKPIDLISGLMGQVTRGNTAISVPYTNRDDEVGALAKALSVFRQNAEDKLGLEEHQKLQEAKSAEDRKKAQLSLASNFENSVKHIVDAVASASTEMHSTSSGVANIAQDSSSQISRLVDVLGNTSNNVQTVASATTELSASIQEISRQMARSATVTAQAVNEAAKAEQTVQQLSSAANKIGEVVSLISDIASQINLLALNATIESARAGEAGKGFAVVASEVKNLAGETSKATEEIASYIKSIQESTAQTVDVISKVGGTIREINNISTTIASAVEEQGVATQSIASNVETASQQTTDVTRNIGMVQSKANETGVSASEMLAAASELSVQAEKLRREVDNFLANVRKG